MSTLTSVAKLAPVAKSLWEDDDFQQRLGQAGLAARSAYGKQKKGAPSPTVIARAGVFVAELGKAIQAGGQAQQTRRRPRRRTTVLLVGAAGGVGAVVVRRRRAADPGPAPVYAPQPVASPIVTPITETP